MKMSRKRSKKEITSKSNKEEILLKSSEKHVTEIIPSEQDSNVDPHSCSPVLNIHIHVPSHNTNNSKNFLPLFKPEIHLHFDEISRKLEVTENGERKEPLCKELNNVLPVGSPRFGDVKCNIVNNSHDKNNELNKNTKTSSPKRRLSTDFHLTSREKKKKRQSNTSKNKRVEVDNNGETSEKNSQDQLISDSVLISQYKDLKIRKAVVLLTDVCKSKAWKNLMPSSSGDSNRPDYEFESSDDFSVQGKSNSEEDIESERCSIKQETVSIISCPLSPTQNVNGSPINDNCTENSSAVNEVVGNTSESQDLVLNKESLTALAEKCSFSEILSLFKVKYNRYLTNIIKHHPNEKDEKCSNDAKDYSSNDMHNNNNESFEENNEIQNSLEEIHKELEVIDKNISNENNLEKESLYLLQEGSNFEVKTEKSELLSVKAEVDDFGNEFSLSESYNSNSKSDKFNFTSERGLNSESLEGDSGVDEGNADVLETKYSNLNVGSIDFHLKLIKKEMRRRSQLSSQKKVGKKAKISLMKTKNSSPSPKKVKNLGKNSEEKATSLSPAEDYIPLNACGPTKFTVAPLDAITPYKTHPAKNFKQEMLFGNRVKRFSSSDQLRILQLKQQAARGRSSLDQ